MKQKTNKMLIFTSLAAYFTYFIHGIGEMCIRDRLWSDGKLLRRIYCSEIKRIMPESRKIHHWC